MFITAHLAKLRESYPSPLQVKDVEGRSPRAWFGSIDRTMVDRPIGELRETVNRLELHTMATDTQVVTLDLSISIFAWGGMHGSNRDRLFNRPVAPWIAIANAVRNGQLSRSE